MSVLVSDMGAEAMARFGPATHDRVASTRRR